MADEPAVVVPAARSETMPEYIRVKNRVLDLLDAAQLSLYELHRVSFEAEKGRESIHFRGEARAAPNALADARKEFALHLMNLYVYMRPKLVKKEGLKAEFGGLEALEACAMGASKLSDAAEKVDVLLQSFNVLRQYCEDVRLTRFEKEVVPPWVRLALGMTSRKR